jgi:hypothetical protein
MTASLSRMHFLRPLYSKKPKEAHRFLCKLGKEAQMHADQLTIAIKSKMSIGPAAAFSNFRLPNLAASI